jgi:hypothetical protein
MSSSSSSELSSSSIRASLSRRLLTSSSSSESGTMSSSSCPFPLASEASSGNSSSALSEGDPEVCPLGRVGDGRLLEDGEGGDGVEGGDHLSLDDLMAGGGEGREEGAVLCMSKLVRVGW